MDYTYLFKTSINNPLNFFIEIADHEGLNTLITYFYSMSFGEHKETDTANEEIKGWFYDSETNDLELATFKLVDFLTSSIKEEMHKALRSIHENILSNPHPLQQNFKARAYYSEIEEIKARIAQLPNQEKYTQVTEYLLLIKKELIDCYNIDEEVHVAIAKPAVNIQLEGSFIKEENLRTEAFNNFHKDLKNYGFIDCILPTFRKVFIPSVNPTPVKWIGNQSEWFYFIKCLNQNNRVDWNNAIQFFLNKEEILFDAYKMRGQKLPKESQKDILDNIFKNFEVHIQQEEDLAPKNRRNALHN